MQVTVTGGAGSSPAKLKFNANDLAYMNATALAANIDATYRTAIYYNPNHPPITPSAGYLIIRKSAASNSIDARGFGAVVDENNGVSSTVTGGSGPGGQTVLAGNGGLVFSATYGSETIDAGGGNNKITLTNDTSASAVYTSTGNDTIYGGGGKDTISAGAGNNMVVLGAGASLVESGGIDTVRLGSGSDTIDVLAGGRVLAFGAASVSGSGFSLVFAGGGLASTILGGAGSYSIQGGLGGGVFQGGTAGDNSIVGGKGAVTITGGGAGDTLLGGTGADQINAAMGNETLGGGAGKAANTFGLTIHEVTGVAGYGTTDTIIDFSKAHDLLSVGNILAINYALNTYEISGGSASFLLEDGTKVVLQGFTGHLTSGSFK